MQLLLLKLLLLQPLLLQPLLLQPLLLPPLLLQPLLLCCCSPYQAIYAEGSSKTWVFGQFHLLLSCMKHRGPVRPGDWKLPCGD